MTDKKRNEIIAANIKSLIKQNNITQKKLADSIGISPSTLSDYMNLRSNPSHGVIQRISDYFNVLKSDIDSTYKEESRYSSTILSQITDTSSKLEEPRQKNVLSYAERQLEEQENDNVVQFPKQIVTGRYTAAGAPIDGDNEDSNASTMIIDKVEIPKSADEIVTIAGDSMEPTYPQGSQVFVHWQPEVEQGEVAIVAIKDEGVTCKKVFYDWEEEEIILRSINEEYPDRIFPIDYIRIIGKVVV